MLDDAAAVETMIGRPPRGKVDVAVRCPLGLPAVTRNEPLLDGEVPFPTRYWLTCPLAVVRVSGLESVGWVKRLTAEVDPAALAAADRAYAAERDGRLAALAPTPGRPLPSGGVGGCHGGVKCLHARYAYWLAGGGDPAGAAVAAELGALRDFGCTESCVQTGGVKVVAGVRT